MESLRREHFNRWYNLMPFYFSVILYEIPFQVSFISEPQKSQPMKIMPKFQSMKKLIFFSMFILQLICTFLYVVGSYFLTGNYTENHRFYLFTLMCLLCTISAQAWGFFIGSTLPIKVSFIYEKLNANSIYL